MGLSYLIEVTSYTFMALFISRFGTTTLAGHQIAGNLGAVLYMTPLSIGIAAVDARLAGARRATLRRRRVARAARHRARLLIACVYGSIVLAARPLIIAAYTPNEAVIAAAMPLVCIIVFYHLFDALQITSAFVLRAYKVDARADRDLRARAVGHRARRRLSARLQRRAATCRSGCRARAASGSPTRQASAWRASGSFSTGARSVPATSRSRRNRRNCSARADRASGATIRAAAAIRRRPVESKAYGSGRIGCVCRSRSERE